MFEHLLVTEHATKHPPKVTLESDILRANVRRRASFDLLKVTCTWASFLGGVNARMFGDHSCMHGISGAMQVLQVCVW